MEGTVIVDGNSVCHAAHNASKLTVGTMQTQAIFGMIKSMRGIINEYQGWKILVLWDGRAQWRHDIYPGYKSNRDDPDPVAAKHKAAYKAQSPFVRKGLSLLGVRQMFATWHEADDLAGIFSKRLSAAGTKVELITGDQDWLQLIDENISWHDHRTDDEVNLTNFAKFTGYLTPSGFLQGKALRGDISDTIGGVGGIGDGTAPEFIAEFGSVENFYSLVESGKFTPKKLMHIRLCGDSTHSKDEWKALFAFNGHPDEVKLLAKHMKGWKGQGRVLFERNMKLMNLQQVPVPDSKDINIIKHEFNEVTFRLLCEKLSFISILRNYENFLEPFRKLR